MARIFGVWILFYPHQMAYPASFKLVLLGVLFDADLNIIFLGSDLRVQYVSTTSTRSPRQKEAADKLSIIFPLFLRIAEPTLFLDIYFLGCVLLELIKMTVFQGLSQGQDYTILGTKRKKKKKKKAAVGRQDIEVSSSKGFHMLILVCTWFWYIILVLHVLHKINRDSQAIETL